MKVRFLIAAVLVSVMLGGCGDSVVVPDAAQRRESTGESWTIMIYMCASTLEEDYNRGSETLHSLPFDLPENINVIVETGGSRSWNETDVSENYIQNYEVQKNGLHLVKQGPSTSMGASWTFGDFISWGMKEYPAQRYMAIIWNHGGGPLGGAAYDSIFNFDSLSLEEMQTALNSQKGKLDIIGFDASLMSNLETACALSLYADYMVAAEDIMPMSGWDYGKLFEFLSENPSATTTQVGEVICDSAAENASDSERELVSMTVSDLSKATKLAQAFEGMAGIMTDAIDDINKFRDIKLAMSELEHMGGNSRWEGFSNLIDLGALTTVVSEQIGSPAANIENAVSEMVVYKNMSSIHSLSSGLSVYYPSYRDGNALDKYRSVCMSESYKRFIEQTCIDTDIPNRVYRFEDRPGWKTYNDLAYENVMNAAPDMTGRYILSAVHPELITRTGVNYYKYSEKDSGYLYLFRDYQTTYDESAGGFVYEFTGRLPVLNSTPVSMYLVSQNTCFDIYSIPVVYEGALSNIRVSRSKQAEDYGKYKIIGVWKGIDNLSGMADRKYSELRTGDTVIPIYEIYGAEGGKYVEGDKIRIGFGGAKITDKLIGDGDYIISYSAEDLFGIKYESGTNNITADKGTIKIMNY